MSIAETRRRLPDSIEELYEISPEKNAELVALVEAMAKLKETAQIHRVVIDARLLEYETRDVRYEGQIRQRETRMSLIDQVLARSGITIPETNAIYQDKPITVIDFGALEQLIKDTQYKCEAKNEERKNASKDIAVRSRLLEERDALQAVVLQLQAFQQTWKESNSHKVDRQKLEEGKIRPFQEEQDSTRILSESAEDFERDILSAVYKELAALSKCKAAIAAIIAEDEFSLVDRSFPQKIDERSKKLGDLLVYLKQNMEAVAGAFDAATRIREEKRLQGKPSDEPLLLSIQPVHGNVNRLHELGEQFTKDILSRVNSAEDFWGRLSHMNVIKQLVVRRPTSPTEVLDQVEDGRRRTVAVTLQIISRQQGLTILPPSTREALARATASLQRDKRKIEVLEASNRRFADEVANDQHRTAENQMHLERTRKTAALQHSALLRVVAVLQAAGVELNSEVTQLVLDAGVQVINRVPRSTAVIEAALPPPQNALQTKKSAEQDKRFVHALSWKDRGTMGRLVIRIFYREFQKELFG